MRVVFVERDNAPERLVCEAEIVFEAEAGALAGMKLVGFSLWRSPEGEIYVTFPSRAFGAGSDRRFFDFLRSVEGQASDAKRVKLWVMEQFKASREATGDNAGPGPAIWPEPVVEHAAVTEANAILKGKRARS